ncbi:DEAD/DEAH box helicase [Rothia nasimurium]|uniref:DEAD/DEAH box helicase n=1 Tax=Rothia nasimurium TaxID=85336 RepID=UPI003618321D
MTENPTPMLVPSLQASDLQQGLTDFLTTTFALTETDTRQALEAFLKAPETSPEEGGHIGDGIFKGPYIRTRLPFSPAPHGWHNSLHHVTPAFPPYGHQAQAFMRLSSAPASDTTPEAASEQATWRRPQPTLVTTGTGSGKTESFLYPILDHVIRANWAGITGMKALILYPMNALANDQAQRLAGLITEGNHPVTAGIYTGENTNGSTVVTATNLITDRSTLRQSPPDILLTNYKMLDMLLLRGADAKLWKDSALSLQYIVLDEFHTYDGAQGTDVAMLLRRLGLTLKHHLTPAVTGPLTENPLDNPHGLTTDDLARPLGRVTPVATSATLGSGGDPSAMLDFAYTVFGEPFTPDAVITESRTTADEWLASIPEDTSGHNDIAKDAPSVVQTASEVFATHNGQHIYNFNVTPTYLTPDQVAQNHGKNPDDYPLGAISHPGLRAALYEDPLTDASQDQPHLISVHAFLRHDYIQAIIRNTQQATNIFELSTAIVPGNKRPVGERDPQRIRELRTSIITTALSGLSVIRKHLGRNIPSVELHQWVRELSRINRKVDAVPSFSWSENTGGPTTQDLYLPAIFCRNCGRSGWGIKKGKLENNYDIGPAAIREAAARRTGDFRPLIYAPTEGENYITHEGDTPRDELRWFHIDHEELHSNGRDLTHNFTSEDWESSRILPVLTYPGLEAVEQSKAQICPACNANDSIRFVGSAIATMLSVTISTLFGSSSIGADEKKALVFTDSVQDAAHRAGFVQARSHSMTLRATFKHTLDSLATTSTNVRDLAAATIDQATTPEAKYQLLDPSIANRQAFKPFWSTTKSTTGRNQAKTYATRRITFDAVLEFGLNSRMGRTLELTGSAAAAVDYGTETEILAIIDAAIRRFIDHSGMLSPEDLQNIPPKKKLQWVTGILERMRMQGGVHHPWLDKFIKNDGATWFLQGGRAKKEGMPGFGGGRPMPAFPRLGEETSKHSKNLDNIAHAQSWYSTWTSRVLGTSPSTSPFLVTNLFTALAEQNIIGVTVPHHPNNTPLRAKVFWIDPRNITIHPTTDTQLDQKQLHVSCSICKMTLPGTPTTITNLDGAPCFVNRCQGTLERLALNPRNYYRKLYSSPATLRVIAREHTSLLPTDLRLSYENGFKGRNGTAEPDAPNVLVATPTLEMGIDIGDLSTVMLSSLPKTVANYQQRIGRAGRQTGNALVLSYIRGAGENLHKLANPLETINGDVKPPATFLNAEEMLRRQYIASIVDTFTASGKTYRITNSNDLFAGVDREGNLLNDLIQTATDNEGYLEAFTRQFGNLLTDDTVASLRTWATEQMPDDILEAARTYTKDLATIKHRATAIQKLIPNLREQAEIFRNSDSAEGVRAEKDLRKVQANLRFFKKQIEELRSKYWIGNLELYGILPNYTLLDDSVELAVGVTTWDPETSERETTMESYVRGASTALSEFAPGNTFYANALEVKIDAVDLGPDRSNVQLWQICHQCGCTSVLVSESHLLKTCPQCSSPIGDRSNLHEVVELQKVSADVERDEATIGDRADDRHRKFFTIVPTITTEENHIGRRWKLSGDTFGVDPLKRVTLRWLNLGPVSKNASELRISGSTYKALKFRLCPECGVLDKDSGSNRYDEHRFWCSHRNDVEDKSQAILLGRTLVTQGVQLHLPSSIQFEGEEAVPSLKAAVLMGMRTVLGGRPEHIDILSISQEKDGQNLFSLLLHDNVPGGTGYLTEFGTPEKVWEVLRSAYLSLTQSNCTCDTACHQCLLPFAPSRDSGYLSKQAAIKALTQILNPGAGEHELNSTSPYTDHWTIEYSAYTPQASPESALESKFSHVLAERLHNTNAKVKTRPKLEGNELTFTIPSLGKPTNWTLKPQPSEYGNTVPDFKLTTPNPQIQDILIYLDSRRYHASASAMRITDDAEKRHSLRQRGEIVWAITDDDINRFAGKTKENLPLPTGIAQQKIDRAQQQDRLSQTNAMINLLRKDSMSILWEWLHNPDTDLWRRFSNTVPFYLDGVTKRTNYTSDRGVHDLIAAQSVGTELQDVHKAYLTETGPVNRATPQSIPRVMWGNKVDYFACYVDLAGKYSTTRPAVYLKHDEAQVATDDYQESWRLWLRYSNLLAFNPDLIVGTSQTAIIDNLAPEPDEPTTDTGTLPEEWQDALATFDDELDRNMIESFTREVKPSTPLPDFGHEIDGCPVTAYWPDSDTILLLFETEDELDDMPAKPARNYIIAQLSDPDAVRAAVAQAISYQN